MKSKTNTVNDNMPEYCRNCGRQLKEEALFCPDCGEKVPKKRNKLFNKYAILIILFIVLTIFLSSIFIFNQSQTVIVDNVKFELPADYVKEPLRTEVSVDHGVKSSSMGWSNDENYIEIGITRMTDAGINSQKVAATLNGTPSKMFGYSGYYLEYDGEGYAFVFGLKDEVCMVYVSDYDAFDDVKVLGQVN